MSDHLLFNRKKYYLVDDNASAISANGRTFYALPKRVKLNKTMMIKNFSGGGIEISSGQIFDVITGQDGDSWFGARRNLPTFYYYLPKSNCTPIWN